MCFSMWSRQMRATIPRTGSVSWSTEVWPLTKRDARSRQKKGGTFTRSCWTSRLRTLCVPKAPVPTVYSVLLVS